MKKIRILSSILLCIFYLLNIVRFIPILLFDDYSDQINTLLGLLDFSIFPLFIIVGIPLLLNLPLFKEKGISYKKVFLCQKKDFKNSFLYYISIILLVTNICAMIISSVISDFRTYGVPMSNDGVYYFVSHGEIIEYIDYNEYKLYSIFDQQFTFSCIIILFFLISNYVKQLYNLFFKNNENNNKNMDGSNAHFQMSFDYNYYKTSLLIVPLLYIIAFIMLTSVVVYYVIYDYISKNINIFIISIVILIAFYFFVNSISLLKYGFNMLFESKENCDEVAGTVSKIYIVRNPFLHEYKYLRRKYYNCSIYAHIIVINNVKYYIMGIQNTYEGSSVRINYLKKSKIVLSIENK